MSPELAPLPKATNLPGRYRTSPKVVDLGMPLVARIQFLPSVDLATQRPSPPCLAPPAQLNDITGNITMQVRLLENSSAPLHPEQAQEALTDFSEHLVNQGNRFFLGLAL